MCKQISSDSLTNVINKLCIYKAYKCIEDLALNNLWGLICRKTQPSQSIRDKNANQEKIALSAGAASLLRGKTSLNPNDCPGFDTK